MMSDVRAGTLDAAFVAVSGPDQPGLTTTTLASEPVLLGCLSDHRLARRAVVSVSELADEAFVDYTPGWGTRTAADQLFAKAGVEPSTASRCRAGRSTLHWSAPDSGWPSSRSR